MKPTRASLTNQYLELEQDLVISQCGWLPQPSLAAPYSRTAEEQELSRRLYEHIILFLQDNGLTTRRILAEGERVADETAIRVRDLTPEGFCFYDETECGYNELLALWQKAEPVDVKYNHRGEDSTRYRGGKYVITNLSQTRPADDDASYKVSLESTGEIKSYPA